jgi:hypothetical protein
LAFILVKAQPVLIVCRVVPCLVFFAWFPHVMIVGTGLLCDKLVNLIYA